jgi:hypothetical protein
MVGPAARITVAPDEVPQRERALDGDGLPDHALKRSATSALTPPPQSVHVVCCERSRQDLARRVSSLRCGDSVCLQRYLHRCGYASGMRAPDPDRTPAAKLCSMCKPDRGCVRMLVPSLSRAAAPVLTRLAQSVNAIALARWSFRSANFCPALRSTIPAAPICGERAQVLVWLEVRGEGWSETADERKSHSARCPV